MKFIWKVYEGMEYQEVEPETRVVNKYKEKYDIYIGRGSKWGNPFVIGKDGNRQEVIEKFRLYLEASPYLLSCLPELRGKTLGCFCKPQACHGDVLVEKLRLTSER